MRARRHHRPVQSYAPPLRGDLDTIRRASAALIAAWDGWVAGPDYQPAISAAARDQVEGLRSALADPAPQRLAVAVSNLLRGVPAPFTATAARNATERLRAATNPVQDDRS